MRRGWRMAEAQAAHCRRAIAARLSRRCRVHGAPVSPSRRVAVALPPRCGRIWLKNRVWTSTLSTSPPHAALAAALRRSAQTSAAPTSSVTASIAALLRASSPALSLPASKNQ